MLEILVEMMFYCELSFPLSEGEWCFTFLAFCHIISLYSTKALVQLRVLKQFSLFDSPIATPLAAHSLTSASHITVFINDFLSKMVAWLCSQYPKTLVF